MNLRKQNPFTTITVEGAILPTDVLQRIAEGDERLGGLRPQDYHLLKTEKINEAASRAWNRLQGAWATFRDEMLRLEGTDRPGTTETRERWLLPLFQELGYGRLQTCRALEIDGKTYPVSHGWGHVPIHLIGFGVDLDRRHAGIAGAARSSPHAMVQELLNRSDDHLWAFLSNGRKLRILRDSASLVRQAYIEFDLEAMMEGEAYADFVLLWMLCHQSRVESDVPEDCWLERWSRAAQEQGARALDALRDGVQQAIEALGTGFLAHPANDALRERLRTGALDRQDYYRQLLRLVYRLLFLFAAEDRDLLLLPDDGTDARRAARARYTRFYAASRLRTLAERHRGSRHPDAYRGLRVVMDRLGSDEGAPALALPALGSFLWSRDAVPDLADADLANRDLLAAVRALSLVERDGRRRPVDYRNLGPEELGSVYESLLELQPVLHLDAATFRLEVVAGSERKTTGSYYTPEPLIASLLDTALDPLLDAAERADDPEQALLGLKVCDPACGSGHFLLAAAHRIAARLAAVRTGDAQAAPEAVRHALRDVIGRCVYGVDLNPMAVELCKVNLWLEALEPGKPLSFLDHHIQVGNSLLGATPARLHDGIPDDAFKPLTGDDNAVVNEYRALNRTFRRKRQHDLFATEAMPWERLGNMPAVLAEIDAMPSDTVADERARRRRYEEAVRSQAYEHARLLADAWCAAFVWEKARSDERPYPIHEEVFRKIERNPHATPHWMKDEIRRLTAQYRFFHWHLAFPDVFRLPPPGAPPENDLAGWNGGFDLVLGNPPWERVKLQEKEFFAAARPDIAGAGKKADRARLIERLRDEDPALYRAFLQARRQAEGTSHLLRNSGLYPLGGRGDVNTYQVFAELFRTLRAPHGRVGVIVPSGIASDDTTKHFFNDLMQRRELASLYDFENREKLFPAVDSRQKFCLLTLTGTARPAGQGADFVFFAHQPADLRDPDRHITLTADDIARLNPNTRTCPIFRSRRDAELTKAIYRRVPVLLEEGPPEKNPWGIKFSTMFHMSNDSHLFRTRAQLEATGCRLEGNVFMGADGERWLPIIEGKMTGLYNHRAASIEFRPKNSSRQQQPVPASTKDWQSPNFLTEPYQWCPENEVETRIPTNWTKRWFIVFKRVTAVTNERTVLACVIPWTAVSYTLYVVSCSQNNQQLAHCLLGSLNSYVADYFVRQKTTQPSLPMGVVYESAFLPPDTYVRPCPWSPGETVGEWLLPRVLELTYTAWDLAAFARDCGYDGPPFRWDEARRERLRAELDAAFFHLYLGTPADWAAGPEALRAFFPTPRHAVDYIMETFPIVRRKDVKRHGNYRTKEMILHVYDRMQAAREAGTAYATILTPPPADASVAHPPRPVEA